MTRDEVAWTPHLLAVMEAVRGVSTPPPAIDAGAARGRVREAIEAHRAEWEVAIAAGSPESAACREVLAWLHRREPLAPHDVVVAGTLIGMASHALPDAPIAHGDDALAWIAATRGLAFAVRAAIAGLGTQPWHAWEQQLVGLVRPEQQYWLRPRDGFHVPNGRTRVGHFALLRARVAAATTDEHGVAVETARELYACAARDEERAALAYAFPGEGGWADALLVQDPVRHAVLVTSTRVPGLVLAAATASADQDIFLAPDEDSASGRAAAVLAMAGTSPPVLDALVRLVDGTGRPPLRRGVLRALACVRSLDAFLRLAARVHRDDAAEALEEARRGAPGLAMGALAEIVATGRAPDDAPSLLRRWITRHGDGGALREGLSPAARSLLDDLKAANVETPASDDEVPDALRARGSAAPAAALEVTTSVDRFAWPPRLRESLPTDDRAALAAERGEALTAAVLLDLGLPAGLEGATDDVIAQACRAGAAKEPPRHMLGVAALPERLALGILRHTPSKRWARATLLAGLGACVARFELCIVDDVLRLARDVPDPCLTLVLPYRVARAAPVVARGLASRARRADAEAWLRQDPALAAAGLLEDALIGSGKGREASIEALRWLARAGHADVVIATARRAGAEAAVRALLEGRPLANASAAPALPAFAAPDRLPPVRLTKGPRLAPAHLESLLHGLRSSQLDDPAAAVVAARGACTPASLAALAWSLFTGWLVAGGSTADRWAMDALAHLGDDTCADALAERIGRWPREHAAHRVQHALDVLAAIPGEATLRALVHLAGAGVTASLRKGAASRALIVAARRGVPLGAGPALDEAPPGD